MSFGFGFEALGLQMANVDVRKENTHAESFYRRLGMTEIHRTKQDIFFIYSREQFTVDKSTHIKVLKSGNNDD